LRRSERPAKPPEPGPPDLWPQFAAPIDDDAGACSVPRGGGWRPGARWAHAVNQAPAPHIDVASWQLPTILIARAGQREIVTAACPIALALGLRPGMAAAHARALVTDLDV